MKYIITSKNKTLENRPTRLWIFSDKIQCQKLMDFLSDCSLDWELPLMFEIDEIIFDGVNL
jgi:hypothetical protein